MTLIIQIVPTRGLQGEQARSFQTRGSVPIQRSGIRSSAASWSFCWKGKARHCRGCAKGGFGLGFRVVALALSLRVPRRRCWRPEFFYSRLSGACLWACGDFPVRLLVRFGAREGEFSSLAESVWLQFWWFCLRGRPKLEHGGLAVDFWQSSGFGLVLVNFCLNSRMCGFAGEEVASWFLLLMFVFVSTWSVGERCWRYSSWFVDFLRERERE